MQKHTHTNKLIEQTSPYLLQHAHNPVNWYPWGDEALEKARKEDKLLLISVGYAACHWCHVMEHESFEDEAVAAIMNKHFVCIKVDREERPDIDQVYMNAVQLLTGRGGWPLNAIALPDGRTVHGGTYFPKPQWLQTLKGLHQVFQEDRTRVEKAAAEIQRGVSTTEVVQGMAQPSAFPKSLLKDVLMPWQKQFDTSWGGSGKAPKFPLPNSLQYLLHHYFYTNDAEILEQLQLTLDRMAHGGIYDQIGGGFARYSVDEYWKVPHFEKMLYDNGQLVSLYSEAYRLTRKPLYRQVVTETIAFVQRELLSPEGGFYASLDADSEGVEGKFYVFTESEFNDLLSDEEKALAEFYNITQQGNWEEGNNIPFITENEAEFAEQHNLTEQQFFTLLSSFKSKAYVQREKRIHPGLDDKILCSWNALMLKGLVEAYNTFGNKEVLNLAMCNAEFISKKFIKADFRLDRNYKAGKSTINAFLDDYAFLIDALVSLYQVTTDKKWLDKAVGLTEYTFTNFYDQQSGMFFFTSQLDPALVARKMELNDGVLPASNSSMAMQLHRLGLLLHNTEWQKISKQMLFNMKDYIPQAAEYYSQWAMLQLQHIFPTFELAIVGTNATEMQREVLAQFQPNIFSVATQDTSQVPLLQDRWVANKTKLYLCQQQTCQLPVETVEEMNQLLLRLISR